MARVITNGKVSIGVYMLPDRKRPCLCKAEGSKIVSYGSFHNKMAADAFMDGLASLVGAKEE